MKNIKLPPNYVSEIANRFNELETRLISAYTPIFQNFNVSQQFAEQMQSISAIYQQNINHILDIDKMTAPLYELSNTINVNMSAYLKQFDFSEIANRYADLLTPNFSSILNAYSQIDFSHLFDNLTITDKYVEMDDESSEAVNNFFNELPQEMNCQVENNSKSSKRFSFTSFIALLTFLLACIQFAYNVHKDHVETLEHQHEKNETESYRTEKLKIEREQLEQYKIIGNAISDLTVQLSELESSIAHSTVSDPQEYSQEHPCTTSEFDKDVDTHKK